MEDKKIVEIIKNVKDKSNKDLLNAEEFLFNQYEETKKQAIEMTLVMEALEKVHEVIMDELKERNAK